MKKSEHFRFTYRRHPATCCTSLRTSPPTYQASHQPGSAMRFYPGKASSVAISCFNIFLLAASNDCISDCQAQATVDSNKCNVLNGATEGTPAVPPGPHGHPERLTSTDVQCSSRLAVNSTLSWLPLHVLRQCLMDHTDILCTPMQADVTSPPQGMIRLCP